MLTSGSGKAGLELFCSSLSLPEANPLNVDVLAVWVTLLFEESWLEEAVPVVEDVLVADISLEFPKHLATVCNVEGIVTVHMQKDKKTELDGIMTTDGMEKEC